MDPRCSPPWVFLAHPSDEIAQLSIDLWPPCPLPRFPTPERRKTAEWLARQITEAFPWASAPAYLVRDNDRAYGHAFTSRVRAMGIRDRPISPGSPWQNPYVERLIGTVRRECLDRMLVFGEANLHKFFKGGSHGVGNGGRLVGTVDTSGVKRVKV